MFRQERKQRSRLGGGAEFVLSLRYSFLYLIARTQSRSLSVVRLPLAIVLFESAALSTTPRPPPGTLRVSYSVWYRRKLNDHLLILSTSYRIDFHQEITSPQGDKRMFIQERPKNANIFWQAITGLPYEVYGRFFRTNSNLSLIRSWSCLRNHLETAP